MFAGTTEAIMPVDLSPYLQLGATAVVAIFALWVIYQNNKSQKSGGGLERIEKVLATQNENHLTHIKDCITVGFKEQAEGTDRIVEAIHSMHIDILKELQKK